MEITDKEKQLLLSELRKHLLPPRKPGGITIREFAETEGISKSKAARLLEELEQKGTLVMQECLDGGRKKKVYYRREYLLGSSDSGG